MKRSSKKGFTLAELLIVIAIIAILVAIMFPVFGAQLNKAKLTADLANVRAAYSEAVADALIANDGAEITETGKLAVSIDEAVATNGSNVTVSGTTVTVSLDSTNTETFTIDEDVALTINERPAA